MRGVMNMFIAKMQIPVENHRLLGLLSADYLVMQICRDTDNYSEFNLFPLKPLPQVGGTLELCRSGFLISAQDVAQAQLNDGLLFIALKNGVIT